MSVTDRISLLFATGLGVGHLSGPTGTYGSLLGIAAFRLFAPVSEGANLLIAVGLFFLAVPAATVASRRFQHTDPKQVVCDEVCGQWISLLYLPDGWMVLFASFLLFRFFDIVKPFPARQFENFPGGWGIVADDVMAGIYANVALQLLLRLAAIVWGP